MQEKHYLVPRHSEGAETDIVQSVAVDTVVHAADYFVDAKDMLLDVNAWAQYAGIPTIHFRLADCYKHFVKRSARRGDHIVISEAGERPIDNYDWLTINALEYDDYPDENRETFAIKLHTSASDHTTSATIVIERRGKTLSAIYHGRNNTDDPAMWHGLQDTQWSALMKGLLEEV